MIANILITTSILLAWSIAAAVIGIVLSPERGL